MLLLKNGIENKKLIVFSVLMKNPFITNKYLTIIVSIKQPIQTMSSILTTADSTVTSSTLSTVADVYVPSVDDNGNYCDGNIKYVFDNNVKCPCCNRIYNSRGIFMQHIKTQIHKKWLDELNKNKHNYYEKYCALEVLTNNQKLIIARLEKEVQQKNKSIKDFEECVSELTLKNFNLSKKLKLLNNKI